MTEGELQEIGKGDWKTFWKHHTLVFPRKSETGENSSPKYVCNGYFWGRVIAREQSTGLARRSSVAFPPQSPRMERDVEDHRLARPLRATAANLSNMDLQGLVGDSGYAAYPLQGTFPKSWCKAHCSEC